MAVNDISADAVTKALAEYRALGEVAFNAKYDVRPAKAYVVVDENGVMYPATAVLRVAHRIQFPMQPPLARGEFSGGRRAESILKKLGFTAGKYSYFASRTTIDGTTTTDS